MDSPADESTPMSLLTLPGESRAQILSYLVPKNITVNVDGNIRHMNRVETQVHICGPSLDDDTGSRIPQLHTVCRVLSQDWLKTIYSEVTFAFDTLGTAINFSKVIGRNNSESVKIVLIDRFELRMDTISEVSQPHFLSEVYPNMNIILLEFEHIYGWNACTKLRMFERWFYNNKEILKMTVKSPRDFYVECHPHGTYMYCCRNLKHVDVVFRKPDVRITARELQAYTPREYLTRIGWEVDAYGVLD